MIKEIPKDKYMTAKDFAKKVGCCKSTVLEAIRRGDLEAYQVGGMYLIKSNAVLKMQRVRDGRYIGITELKRGDLKSFLRKRGIDIEGID